MSERVVDLLEAVEVHQQHRATLALADRGRDRVVERQPVGQTRQRVVPCGVLAACALPDRVVDREHRRQEQGQQQRRVGHCRDHDRRQEQQHAGGDENEEKVVAQVPQDRLVLMQGHGDAHRACVDEQECRGGGQYGGKLGAREGV